MWARASSLGVAEIPHAPQLPIDISPGAEKPTTAPRAGRLSSAARAEPFAERQTLLFNRSAWPATNKLGTLIGWPRGHCVRAAS